MTSTRGIFYFQYRDNGEAIRGAGFARIVVRGGACNIECCLQGLKGADEGTRNIQAVTVEGELSIGDMAITNGRGQCRIGEILLDYEKLVGIRIPLTEKRDVYCEIRKVTEPAEAMAQGEVFVQAEKKEQPETSEKSKDMKPLDSMKNMVIKKQPELLGEAKTEKVEIRDNLDPTEEMRVTGQLAPIREQNQIEIAGEPEQPKQPELPEQEKIPEIDSDLQRRGQQDNKWKQLCDIYTHIHPFRDKREYLAIGPQDFVILTEKYYKLAQNSFLLHGYYQYQHLLLGRTDRRCGSTYYIGVPGSYFEKEKQVAMLYGFESFEAKEEPAKEGDFGYYFVKVEI